MRPVFNVFRQRRTYFVMQRAGNSGISDQLNEEITLYAKKRQTGISLKTLMDTGAGTNLGIFEKMFGKNSSQTTSDSEKVQIQVLLFSLYTPLIFTLVVFAFILNTGSCIFAQRAPCSFCTSCMWVRLYASNERICARSTRKLTD